MEERRNVLKVCSVDLYVHDFDDELQLFNFGFSTVEKAINFMNLAVESIKDSNSLYYHVCFTVDWELEDRERRQRQEQLFANDKKD